MQSNIIDEKLNRIYASIGIIKEDNINKVKPKFIKEDNQLTITFDFMGDMSDADIVNNAQLLIHNIASLKYHLIRLFRKNQYDDKVIIDTFSNSLELKIIEDLWNNDKHGYPPRNGGHTGISPKLENIVRVLQMRTNPEKGASLGIFINMQGEIQKTGSGAHAVIITGDIMDANGIKIGDLYEMALNAVLTWEDLLSHYNIISTKQG